MPILIAGQAFLFVLALSAGSAHGQVLLSPALQDESQAADSQGPKPKTKVITLHPAGEPDPALRYRFWPAIDQRRHVSPHPFLSRATLIATQASAQDRDNEFSKLYEKISELPLDQVAGEETRQFLHRFGTPALEQLSRIDHAMDTHYDLQLEGRSLNEVVELLLPEVQESRQLARLLSVRARLAVAEERWDDAVDDLRIGFRLAEIIGDSAPLLVNKLVGFAIAGLMLSVVEEAIQQPDCPNLYWALASIPSQRVFELRDALEFEVGNIARALRVEALKHPGSISTDMARDQLVSLVRQVTQLADSINGNRGDNDDKAAQLLAGIYVVAMAAPSRELLSESRDWAAKAADLSTSQAVLLATQLRLLRNRDDWTKWNLLPADLDVDIEDKLDAGNLDLRSTDVVTVLTALLMPALNAANHASRRSIQLHHLWMTLEALRMHAAQSGELPESLDDLQPVPALPDAIAQKPFEYERASPTTATLTHAPHWGREHENVLSIQLIVDKTD